MVLGALWAAHQLREEDVMEGFDTRTGQYVDYSAIYDEALATIRLVDEVQVAAGHARLVARYGHADADRAWANACQTISDEAEGIEEKSIRTAIQRGTMIIETDIDTVKVYDGKEWHALNSLRYARGTNGLFIGLDSSNCIVIRRMANDGGLVFQHTITNVESFKESLDMIKVLQDVNQEST